MNALAEVTLDMSPPEVIVRLMLTFDRAADDFLGDCRRRGYSTRTLVTYRRTYDEFADRLPLDLDVAKVGVTEIRRYLASKSRLAPGTVAGIEAHLASLFRWLLVEGKIARDPMGTLPRTKRQPPEDLDVTTVTGEDVRRLLLHAHSWAEKLALGLLVYLGPRRHAVALLRLDDYDRARGRIRFREKGGKTIWKPVPDELDRLLEAAISAGVYEQTDYLIPPEGYLARPGERDDRVVWRLVKKVADRAGVDAHPHALRAAFAVLYDEANPGDTLALRDLMGHRSVRTLEAHYLRRRDKEAGMEKVRSLSWGMALMPDNEEAETFDLMSHVYFIAAGDINVDATPVKVGFSGDPPGRLRDLQTSHHGDLRLVATAPGSMLLERELQRQLAGDRLRGEWFSSSQRLRNVIRRLGNVELYVPVDSGKKPLESPLVVGAGGFEPPFSDRPLGERAGRIPREAQP